MKKNTICLFGIFVLSLLVLSCEKDDKVSPDNLLTRIEYVESDSIFVNPERGFYAFQEFRSDNNNVLTLSSLAHLRNNAMSLVYTTYTMPDYRDRLIPQDFLDRIRDNMEVLRAGGCKTILRFRYTSSTNDIPWDAPEDIVHEHVRQLTPLLHDYSDVILVLEAGFIGVWGEWYYTEHFNYRPSEEEYGPRRRLLDALLEALPTNRMICVRYPAAKLYSFGLHHTDTITREDAYNGSTLSRIAFHNDCFLADQDDRGTFGGNRNFRRYWAAESKYLAMGGETCGVSSYSTCSNAIEDLAKYHWSFLNISYHPSVIGQWNNEGCMPEIRRRLGYRFVLNYGEYSTKAEAGNKFEMTLNLKNVGFAAPFNPRDLEIVFVSKVDESEVYKLKLQEDPRFWFPDEDIEFSAVFGLPVNMPVGEYNVYLHLPDPESHLYGRKEFSIRLANEGVWDYKHGYNHIHSVTINAPSTNVGFQGDFLRKVN